jgi:hypothetical protein
MEKAKRRQMLDLDYGKPDTWLIDLPQRIDAVKSIAKREVPEKLANEFFRLEDGELIEVPHDAVLPSSWPLSMRLIEAYDPAMNWVRQKCNNIPRELMSTAMTNACRVFAMAVILAEERLSEDSCQSDRLQSAHLVNPSIISPSRKWS